MSSIWVLDCSWRLDKVVFNPNKRNRHALLGALFLFPALGGSLVADRSPKLMCRVSFSCPLPPSFGRADSLAPCSFFFSFRFFFFYVCEKSPKAYARDSNPALATTARSIHLDQEACAHPTAVLTESFQPPQQPPTSKNRKP